MGSTLSKIRGRKGIALPTTKKSRSTRASPVTEQSSATERITPTEAQYEAEGSPSSDYGPWLPVKTVRREDRYSHRTPRTVLSCEDFCAYADDGSIMNEQELYNLDLVEEEETITEEEIDDQGEIPNAHTNASEEEHTLIHFPKFPELAPEIRLKIWKQICFLPRMVDLWQVQTDFIFPHCRIYEYKSHCPIPAILHTSQEARDVGLKYYIRGFGREAEQWTVVDGPDGHWAEEFLPLQFPPRIYFNPQCDIICPIPEEEVFYEPWNHKSNLDQMLSDISKGTPSVTKIAVEHHEGFYCHPGFFPNLREIYFYRTSGLPERFDPNMELSLALELLDFNYWQNMEIWWHNGDGTADKIVADKLPAKVVEEKRKTKKDEMEARFRAEVKFRKMFLEVDWTWRSGVNQVMKVRRYRPLLQKSRSEGTDFTTVPSL